MIKRVLTAIRRMMNNVSMHVTIDGSDSSITLSKAVVKAMRVMEDDKHEVIVFHLGEEYAFTADASLEDGVYRSTLQLNKQYGCVGFETLYPTASAILHDYGFDPLAAVRLSVKEQMVGDMRVFVIKRRL